MNRSIRVGFGVVYALALLSGFGCAVTNYELIADADGFPINTAGNAYIRPDLQVASEYPDGTDVLIWYVDQKANGDRKLSTVNFYTPPGATTQFKDELYCTSDFSGCKVATADDPETGDVDEYDVTQHASCSGYRSLILLVSMIREFGECGRAVGVSNGLKMMGLASSMTPVEIDGVTWMRKELSAQNTSIVLDGRDGNAYAVPLTTTVGVRANFAKRQLVLDLKNPSTRTDFQQAIAWCQAHPSAKGYVATITVDGVDLTYHVKFAKGAAIAINRRYR